MLLPTHGRWARDAPLSSGCYTRSQMLPATPWMLVRTGIWDQRRSCRLVMQFQSALPFRDREYKFNRQIRVVIDHVMLTYRHVCADGSADLQGWREQRGEAQMRRCVARMERSAIRVFSRCNKVSEHPM